MWTEGPLLRSRGLVQPPEEGQSVHPHHPFTHGVHRDLWGAPISDGLGTEVRLLLTSLSDLGPVGGLCLSSRS